jgi:hypothetical protein
MDSDHLNKWLTLGANIAVLAGIIILAIEIRQNSEHLALQLKFQAAQKIFENNRDLQEPSKALIYSKALTQPSEMTIDEGLVAASIVLNHINEWEDRFFIYESGLISESEWKRHIHENIGWTLGNPFAKKVWQLNRSAYEPEFAKYIEGLLPDVADDESIGWWEEVQSTFDE